MKPTKNLPMHGRVNDRQPFSDSPLHIGRPNIGSKEAFLKYVGDIFDRPWLTNNGPLLQEFEHRVADHLGVKHCVAICNGTVALEIAIRAIGLKGKVIVPSYTSIGRDPCSLG